jgi:hypothetical protein
MQQEFAREVLTRLPLAEAVLTLWRGVVDEFFLHSVFARHHGAGDERVISFGSLVQLIADALLEHRGSGRKSFARHHGGPHKTARFRLHRRLVRRREEVSHTLFFSFPSTVSRKFISGILRRQLSLARYVCWCPTMKFG